MQIDKFQVIIDIIQKIAMIILVILLIGAMWQMNKLMLNLINEFHSSYVTLEAIRGLIDNSWWF